MSGSFRQSLLGFDPLQEHAFARADAGTHPEDRELLASNEIVDAPAVFLMAEEELRDLVGAAQDVTGDVGCGARLKGGVARASGWRKRWSGSRSVGHENEMMDVSDACVAARDTSS
jgi:hypothetical protein